MPRSRKISNTISHRYSSRIDALAAVTVLRPGEMNPWAASHLLSLLFVTNAFPAATFGTAAAAFNFQERLIMAQAQAGTNRTAEVTSSVSGTTSDIMASIQIEAEARRILYALATPEYMEAWLHPPGVERVDCHPERRSYDKFRIDMICSGKRSGSIYGACLLSRPNRVTYFLESDRGGGLAKSRVEVYLYVSVNRCILKLKHSGLSSQKDREWYSRMWERSLDKLSKVIGGSGAVAVNSDANTML